MSDEQQTVVHKVEVDGLFGVIGYIGLGFLTYALAYDGTLNAGDAWTWATIALWPFFIAYWIAGKVLLAVVVLVVVVLLAFGTSELKDRFGRK